MNKRICLLTTILLFNCLELPYSPYDKGYSGEYYLNLQISTNDSIYPFLPYAFHYISGADSFLYFDIDNGPAIMDMEFFNDRNTRDSLYFYFTHPFIDNLKIIGIRPNGLSDTFSYRLSITNPLSIQYKRIVSNPDTVKFYLSTEYDTFFEHLKKIIWYQDSIPVDTVLPKDSLLCLLTDVNNKIISARCFDWYENSYLLNPCTLLVNTIKSNVSIFISNPVFSGDSIIPDFLIKSHKGDSATINIKYNNQIINMPIEFSQSDSMFLKVNLGLAEKTGDYPVEFTFIDSNNISMKHIFNINIAPFYRKNIISAITTNPSIIYDKEYVELSIQAGLTPDGNTCDKFFWSFNGDTIWDTTTSTSQLRSIFSGDTLRLVVRCSYSNSFYSEIVYRSIPINPGLPIISKLVLPNQLQYLSIPFEFRIWAYDNPGGLIDSYKITMINPSGDSLITTSSESVISIRADMSLLGQIRIISQVKDSSGHWSSAYPSGSFLTVANGAPEITSLNFTDTVWLIKPAFLHVEAQDINGNLCKLIVDWDDSTKEVIEINQKRFSKVLKHTYKTYDKETRIIKVLFTDNDNFQRSDSVKVQIHHGAPLVKAVSSSTGFRQNNILYVKDIRSSGGTCANSQHIQFPVESFDSNGVVFSYHCDIDSPFSVESAIGKSYTKLMTFEIPNCDSSIFSIQKPFVKSTIFSIDNDGFIGADTVFLGIDRSPPSNINILVPTDGDTIRTPNLNFIWSGGIDSLDSLDTRFSLLIKYQYDTISNSFKDSLFYDGTLKDFKDPGSVNLKFKMYIDKNLSNSKQDNMPVTFRLELKDRLTQSIIKTIKCYEQ